MPTCRLALLSLIKLLFKFNPSNPWARHRPGTWWQWWGCKFQPRYPHPCSSPLLSRSKQRAWLWWTHVSIILRWTERNQCIGGCGANARCNKGICICNFEECKSPLLMQFDSHNTYSSLPSSLRTVPLEPNCSIPRWQGEIQKAHSTSKTRMVLLQRQERSQKSVWSAQRRRGVHRPHLP